MDELHPKLRLQMSVLNATDISEITQEALKCLIFYNKDTGEFINLKTGFIYNCPPNGRYLQIKLAGRYVNATRVAVFYMTGKWPTGVVDHIDENTSHNWWLNLEDISQSENIKRYMRNHPPSYPRKTRVSLDTTNIVTRQTVDPDITSSAWKEFVKTFMS